MKWLKEAKFVYSYTLFNNGETAEKLFELLNTLCFWNDYHKIKKSRNRFTDFSYLDLILTGQES